MATPLQKNLNLLGVLLRMYFRTSDYRSFAGALWSFMGPLTAFLVMYLIFDSRFGKQVVHFPLRLLVSIICLGFFNNMVVHGMRFFERHREVLLNSRVPPEILLISSLFVPMLKFLVEITLCLAAGLAAGALHPLSIPLYYALAAAFLLLVLGITLHFIVLSALAGDVTEIWSILWPMMLFITPTFYTLDMLSPWARLLVLNLNPATAFIMAFQSLAAGAAVPFYNGGVLVQCFLNMAVFLLTGYYAFKRFETKGLETA